MWDYIKKNNLQNPSNKREILADDKLEKIFGKKDVQHGVDAPDAGASDRRGASELTPDLPDDAGPVDPTAPETSGTMAPPTEFGQAGG